MIVLYAKVGTGPAGYIRVYRKRTLPKVGDFIRFKPSDFYGRMHHDERWRQWQGGVVDGMYGVGGQTLYLVARM